MITRCSACGKEMEVSPDVADGQHIKCPSCGEKTTCRKPTRIEVPAGKGVRHSRQEQAEEKQPRFKLQRPGVSSDEAVDPNALAIMRRLEIEQAAESETEGQESTVDYGTSRLESIMKTAVMVLVVAACIVGGEWWRRTKRAKEEQLVLQQHLEEEARAAKRKAELEAARARDEAMRAEREKAREQERLRREQEKAAREKKREDERKAAAEKAAAIKAAKERFNDAMRMFDGAVVLTWRQLAKEKRPGATDAAFLCLAPGENGRRPELYEVTSKSDGECTVILLSPTGSAQELSLADLEQKMNAAGGIVHDGKLAYLFCPKENTQPQPIPPSAVNPSKLCLGALYNMLRASKMSTERLTFETRLNVPGRKATLLAKTVRFDEQIRADAIDDALRQVAIAAVGTVAPKKPQRRTVTMYDGSVTKKQLNKPTLVPKNPRNRTQSWQGLASEARRQESEELQSEAEIERLRSKAVEDKVKQLRESATLSVHVKAANGRNMSSGR